MQSHGNSSKPWRSAAGERRAWKIQSFRTNIRRGKIMILWCISLSIFNNTYIPRAYIKDMPNFQCSDVLRNLFEFYAGCYNMHTVSIFGTGTLWPNHYCTYHIVSMWLMACMRIICHICAAMATETGFQLIWKKALAGRLLAWLLNSTHFAHFVNGIFLFIACLAFSMPLSSIARRMKCVSMRVIQCENRFLLTPIFGEIIMFEWSAPNGFGRFFPRIIYTIF